MGKLMVMMMVCTVVVYDITLGQNGNDGTSSPDVCCPGPGCPGPKIRDFCNNLCEDVNCQQTISPDTFQGVPGLSSFNKLLGLLQTTDPIICADGCVGALFSLPNRCDILAAASALCALCPNALREELCARAAMLCPGTTTDDDKKMCIGFHIHFPFGK